MLAGEGGEVVLLEEVIYTHAEQLGDQTDVVAVVKPGKQMDAFATTLLSTIASRKRAGTLTVDSWGRAPSAFVGHGPQSCLRLDTWVLLE